MIGMNGWLPTTHRIECGRIGKLGGGRERFAAQLVVLLVLHWDTAVQSMVQAVLLLLLLLRLHVMGRMMAGRDGCAGRFVGTVFGTVAGSAYAECSVKHRLGELGESPVCAHLSDEYA